MRRSLPFAALICLQAAAAAPATKDLGQGFSDHGAAAPNATVCGGSAFPMRFFSYDPRGDQWVRQTAFGQWNTVGTQGDRFFVGAYSGGQLLEWDPAAPWVDTVEGRQDCNPRVLTRCSPDIIRPARLLMHPDGQTIIMGAAPAERHPACVPPPAVHLPADCQDDKLLADPIGDEAAPSWGSPPGQSGSLR